jgi:hypothetical protein
MSKLADINNNKKRKVVFFHLGIYDLLKHQLGFRYTKINKKGYYLKESNGIFVITDFEELRDSFKAFIKENFDTLELSNEINLNDFLEEYYRQGPIRNGNFARDFLSEDFQLSEYNLDLIKKEHGLK